MEQHGAVVMINLQLESDQTNGLKMHVQNLKRLQHNDHHFMNAKKTID